MEVAHYVQDRLRKSLEREVRNTLRSECPRPSLLGKVDDTPELDPNMATFLKTFTKDPKKGLDMAWRGCQDNLLDRPSPLTKNLELAFQAKEAHPLLGPGESLEWVQRAICLLGNANCSMSRERQKLFITRIDPKLAELASSEAGTMVKGLLFGDKFVKDLGKYGAMFSALDKAHKSIKKVFNSGLFSGLGAFEAELQAVDLIRLPEVTIRLEVAGILNRLEVRQYVASS
ncbi:hypothetical protein NDU88_003905 [Pleurodeles waltl]|uniref:Uncharacterized protein n=1 Tax=Pleurodeles waltl TaxID=8319 RepID=A0AAV7L754_PLEWA|nr:hypothetical protein NDU88_003905 [Pleurodeles waltl]